MSVRDLILTVVVLGAVPFVLRRPFIGLLLWVWLGTMNPHQLVWGAARSIPFAQVIAIATLVGMLFNRNHLRFKGSLELGILISLVLWMTLTTIFAFYPEAAWVSWERVAKIQLMTFVAFLLVNTKRQLDSLLWVVALSLGYYGVKGGIFTILSGGGHRVWGPGDSVVGDNNALALALVVTIPLFVYLRSQATNKWIRLGVLAAIMLCAVSVLGSQSRGAFLAVSTIVLFLWLKSRRKILLGVALISLVPPMIAFMPDSWNTRMESIKTYEADSSAMQRLNAWTTAINIANDRPLVGGGFNLTTAVTFARYAPRPEWVHVAHSIYFQMLGEHGWVGFALFLALWGALWRRCRQLVGVSRGHADLAWAGDLGSMIQVSLIGYLVGGAFLSLGYWDVPYYLVVIAVVAHWIVRQEFVAANGQRPALQMPPAGTTASPRMPRQSA